jgi:cysteine-rich repeat protein
MSRRVGQIIAMLSVLSLVVVVIAYQMYDQNRLRTDVLDQGYGDVAPCGNGVMDQGENCDDGNTISGDGCSDVCVSEEMPFCGDSMVEGTEQCDDGNAILGDGCDDLCQNEPPPPVCGNGTLEAPEQCDDANIVNGDGCSDTCQIEIPPAVCGNGTMEGSEQCDDGNVVAGDGCSDVCMIEVVAAVCGNSVLEGTEQCDDGNVIAGDGCSDVCVTEAAPAVCGNNVLEGTEQCDDGNVVDGDGCSSICVVELAVAVCGNANVEAGEQCDDGNVIAGDGCSDLCQQEQTMSTTSTTTGSSLSSNVPQSSTLENGLIVHRYMTLFGEKTVLDGLQVPQYVPSFSSEVRWSADASNSTQIAIDDVNSARTFFMAPSQEADFTFLLEVKQGSTYSPVAKYVFSVLSPLVYSADANKDGKYDFSDLLNLLQNWNSYGNEATQVLAVILSRYEQ